MAARSTVRSSKGRTTPWMSWPCSWPLPHDQHGVTGPGAGDRGGDGGGPVGVDQDLAALVDGHLGGAREHRGEDGQRVLGAGVVGGQHGGVGEPGGCRPHRSAFCGVAVAAAAEHDVQSALGDLAQGAQDGLDGVGLVRVVDEREVGLSGVDAFQPAGDSGDRGDAVGRGLRVDARDGQGDDRGEGVGDVERAGQRGPGGDPLALGADNGEGGAQRADFDVLGAPVGVQVALGGEGDDRNGRPGDQPAAVLVVEVDDAPCGCAPA